MLMIMQRGIGRHRMGAGRRVIVPMKVCRPIPVPMRMDVPLCDRNTARREIKRIIVPGVMVVIAVVVGTAMGVIGMMMVGCRASDLPPCTYSDPKAKRDQGNACRDVDQVAETLRCCRADEPDA